jgi:hypothetical protein
MAYHLKIEVGYYYAVGNGRRYGRFGEKRLAFTLCKHCADLLSNSLHGLGYNPELEESERSCCQLCGAITHANKSL